MIEIFQSFNRSTPLRYSAFKFPGGEMQVQVGRPSSLCEQVMIYAHLTCSDDIMELALAKDALDRMSGGLPGTNIPVNLVCPYLPYARQDRVMENGESLGLKVLCNQINAMGFDSVEVWDVHSDVALALLNKARNRAPEYFLQLIDVRKPNTVLVAPDAGAIKKVFKVAKGLGFDMVRADKNRSTKDGTITGTTVYSEHIGDKDFLIVDDICDGGRTFTELAKELRPLTNGRVLLYVTHGIFSKGLQVFDGLIDHIYTAKPFPNVEINEKLTVLSWKETL